MNKLLAVVIIGISAIIASVICFVAYDWKLISLEIAVVGLVINYLGIAILVGLGVYQISYRWNVEKTFKIGIIMMIIGVSFVVLIDRGVGCYIDFGQKPTIECAIRNYLSVVFVTTSFPLVIIGASIVVAPPIVKKLRKRYE